MCAHWAIMAQSFYFLFGKQIKAGMRELDTAFGLTLGPHLLRSPEDLTCAGCSSPAGALSPPPLPSHYIGCCQLPASLFT